MWNTFKFKNKDNRRCSGVFFVNFEHILHLIVDTEQVNDSQKPLLLVTFYTRVEQGQSLLSFSLTLTYSTPCFIVSIVYFEHV